MSLVRVGWVKGILDIQSVGSYKGTSLVEEELAECLEKFGYCEITEQLNPGRKKMPVEKKVHKRPVTG